MNYKNSEMKIDQLVSYLNEEKINLSPAFQRGHVWSLRVRRKLLSNMIQGKPIPAIFLYKEASGAKYSYNIVDGKQRIESVILFIANSRQNDLAINKWERYFFEKLHKKDGHFWIYSNDVKTTFQQLNDEVVRDFREYAIPTVEIQLDDKTSLDEVITLFVDINQMGVEVQRFAVVKAMCKDDALLKRVFALIARYENRAEDVFYRMKHNEFTKILKRLQVVVAIKDNNSRIDRMWELMLELALFVLTGKHRKPVEILRGFISKKHVNEQRLTIAAERKLRYVFRFLSTVFTKKNLGNSRFANDQTQFYSLITAILRSNWINTFGSDALMNKIARVACFIDGQGTNGLSTEVQKKLKQYIEMTRKQTTDISKRQERENLITAAIEAA